MSVQVRAQSPEPTQLFTQPSSQSFDARSFMLKGKREEALELLHRSYAQKAPKKDQRQIQAMIESFSTQFLNQESENLYFEALHLIGNHKWNEAREKLEQANAKDPHHVLILMRLAQTELKKEPPQKESAEERLKQSLKLNPFHQESKLLWAWVKSLQGEEREALKVFEAHKNIALQFPVLLNEYLQVLKKTNKVADIAALKKRVLHPSRGSSFSTVPLLIWVGFAKLNLLSKEESKIARTNIDKCASNFNRCYTSVDLDSKRSQYLWMMEHDELLKDVTFLTLH